MLLQIVLACLLAMVYAFEADAAAVENSVSVVSHSVNDQDVDEFKRRHWGGHYWGGRGHYGRRGRSLGADQDAEEFKRRHWGGHWAGRGYYGHRQGRYWGPYYG